MNKLRKATAVFAFFVGGLILGNGPHSQEVGSVLRGHRIAQQFCAECHLVDDDKGGSVNAGAPSFGAIAGTPGLTEAAVAAMLQTSHRKMPNVIIRGADLNDIVLYILSLKEND